MNSEPLTSRQAAHRVAVVFEQAAQLAKQGDGEAARRLITAAEDDVRQWSYALGCSDVMTLFWAREALHRMTWSLSTDDDHEFALRGAWHRAQERWTLLDPDDRSPFVQVASALLQIRAIDLRSEIGSFGDAVVDLCSTIRDHDLEAAVDLLVRLAQILALDDGGNSDTARQRVLTQLAMCLDRLDGLEQTAAPLLLLRLTSIVPAAPDAVLHQALSRAVRRALAARPLQAWAHATLELVARNFPGMYVPGNAFDTEVATPRLTDHWLAKAELRTAHDNSAPAADAAREHQLALLNIGLLADRAALLRPSWSDECRSEAACSAAAHLAGLSALGAEPLSEAVDRLGLLFEQHMDRLAAEALLNEIARDVGPEQERRDARVPRLLRLARVEGLVALGRFDEAADHMLAQFSGPVQLVDLIVGARWSRSAMTTLRKLRNGSSMQEEQVRRLAHRLRSWIRSHYQGIASGHEVALSLDFVDAIVGRADNLKISIFASPC